MPRKKLSPETVAIIAAIEHATGAAKIVADSVAGELEKHTKHDDDRFAALTALVESIALDVKSLLGTRSYARGAWKGMTLVAVAVFAIAKAVHDYWDSFVTLVRGR